VSDLARILAIDPGERRVGLAVSDPLGVTAQGLETFDRRGGDLLDHIERVIGEYGVAHVVVGHPLSMSGRPNTSSLAAEALARSIRGRFGVEVTLWDERLSSHEARRAMAGTGVAKRSKGAVDRVAAVLILQGFLDSRRQGGETP
jgi:putative Holliday junction resolvase